VCAVDVALCLTASVYDAPIQHVFYHNVILSQCACCVSTGDRPIHFKLHCTCEGHILWLHASASARDLHAGHPERQAAGKHFHRSLMQAAIRHVQCGRASEIWHSLIKPSGRPRTRCGMCLSSIQQRHVVIEAPRNEAECTSR
jgi:hypothetical protein